MRYLRLALLFYLPFCIISCNPDYRNNRNLLKNAGSIIEQDPDSVLNMVKYMDGRILTESQYFEYVILRVRAKDLSGMDISGDTVVFRARDYFVESRDERNASFSLFVSGKVYQVRNQPYEAMNDYIHAIVRGDRNNFLLNAHIYYNIACLFYNQRNYTESLSFLKRGESFYNQTDCHYKYKFHLQELIALNYLYLDNPDSSLYYFEKAMGIAIQRNNTAFQMRVFQNKSVLLKNTGYYDKAKKNCMRAIMLTNGNDSITLGRLYLNLSSIFNSLHSVDTASLYAYKAKNLMLKSKNIVDLTYLYETLSKIEQIKGNHQLVEVYDDNQFLFSKIQRYQDKKSHDFTLQGLEDMMNKYQTRQKILITAVVMLSLVLTIVLISILFYRVRGNLRDIREEVETIKKMSGDERLQIIFHVKDVACLKELLDEANPDYRKIRTQVKLILQKTEWNNIYDILNQRYNGLFDHIRKDYDLTGSEYKVCCLAYAGFDNLEISYITNIMYNTVRNKKSAAKKKLNISNETFQEFLNKKYSNLNL